jgi:hypothetical protein
MENQDFNLDLSEFEIASKPNYRKTPVVKPPKEKPVKPYNVKFNFKTKRIEFDSNIAEAINLKDSSLVHAKSVSKGRILIAVVNGNEGLFAKGVTGAEKGRKFKNRKLAEDLVELNLTSGTYKLDYIGEAPVRISKNKTIEKGAWYNLTMVGEPQLVTLTESESEENEQEEFSIQ